MDADKTTEFIGHVQTIPLLWKKDDKDFLNRDKKRKAFEELAEIFGISADECKKKLKNLKDRMREICSKLPKTRSGQPAFENGEITVRWPYYKPLLFMKDQFIGRPMISSVEGDLECQSILSDDSNEESETTRTSTSLSAQSTMSTSAEGNSRLNERNRVRSKPKRQGVEEEFLAIEREKMESVRMALQMKPEQEQDEWDKFASSISCDLRKLKDPFIIIRAKANIHKQVNEAVLEQLSMNRGNSAPMEYQMNCTQTGSMDYAAAMSYQTSTTYSDRDELHRGQYHQI